MKLHRGRLIDHVHLRSRNLDAARAFYRAVLAALGRQIVDDNKDHFWCDELWIDKLGDNQAEASHVHLCFQAEDIPAVDAFHAAGLKAGGKDNGAPGERKAYHPGYYAAFLIDPDGNNIEAVYHGPAERSAASVELTFEMPKEK